MIRNHSCLPATLRRSAGFGLLAASLALPLPAVAEEVALSFRLLTHNVTRTSQQIGSGSQYGEIWVGTAVFDDGRMAGKEFVTIGRDSASAGEFMGYSTYFFENGDSVETSFTATWGADGVKGDYTVLGGTGAYEGATGTGHFESADGQVGTGGLFTGGFTLDVPGT